jgi:hypothetical protein
VRRFLEPRLVILGLERHLLGLCDERVGAIDLLAGVAIVGQDLPAEALLRGARAVAR